tara:strand:+ start:284 stop:631 length:348 start_codon:yes stop_codon:yes gene_type:complete
LIDFEITPLREFVMSIPAEIVAPPSCDKIESFTLEAKIYPKIIKSNCSKKSQSMRRCIDNARKFRTDIYKDMIKRGTFKHGECKTYTVKEVKKYKIQVNLGKLLEMQKKSLDNQE